MRSRSNFTSLKALPPKLRKMSKPPLPAHLANQAELETRGALAFAGPVSDETGELMQEMGLNICRAESLEAALADADPVHKSVARSYVLRRWMISEGSLNLSVGLTTNKAELS